jgi:alginate O-acetyltransferase complex protein AlgF
MKYLRLSKRLILGLSMTLGLISVTASAQDGSLYAPPPPADAAAVRALTLIPGAATTIQVGLVKLQARAGLPSGYHYVKQGQVPVKVAGQEAGQEAAKPFAAGRYYSIVAGNFGREKFRIYTDPKPSLSKATIVFYNLSALDQVSLKTADGKITLQQGVAHGASVSRDVNPLRVGFAVFQGAKKLGVIAPVQLRRGATLGIFLTQGSPQVFSAPGASVGK